MGTPESAAEAADMRALAIALGGLVASSATLAILTGFWILLAVPGFIVATWLLLSPYRCLLVTFLAFAFERVGVIQGPDFGVKPFQVCALVTAIAVLIDFGIRKNAPPTRPVEPARGLVSCFPERKRVSVSSVFGD